MFQGRSHVFIFQNSHRTKVHHDSSRLVLYRAGKNGEIRVSPQKLCCDKFWGVLDVSRADHASTIVSGSENATIGPESDRAVVHLSTLY